MHGAIVSSLCLSDSCTTGEARSTSHVVKITFACSPISLSAQVFDVVGSSPWVLQVLITIWRPRTPPFLLILAASIFAAASAGVSNGCIGPLLSYAQPMTIGFLAADEPVRAAAAATKTSAAAATSTSAQRARLPTLIFLLSGPRLQPGPSFSTSS